MLGTILNLQPRLVLGGGKSREETVLELIIQLFEQVHSIISAQVQHTLSSLPFPSQIPEPFDRTAIIRRYELDKSPLTTVLLQEIGLTAGQ